MSALPSRLRLNAITNYANTATAIVVALVVTPVLLHGLGKSEYGIWILVASTVLYRDLFNLGFDLATVKYVAELSAKGDTEAARRAVVTAVGVLAVPGVLALVVRVG